MNTNQMSQFELAFCKSLNCKKAASFWKARVALYALLRSMGAGPGDEVILPGYTCVMDVNPIKYVGAKPVYVDIEPDTFNMIPALIKEKITAKTKLVIAQHTYGYPCDMDAILEIARQHNIPVIEDCCLALGSKYKGQLCGSLGKAAYFSFQWNKPFTTGLGGMAITNDDDLADKIEQLRKQQMLQPTAKDKFMLAAQLAVYRTFIYPRTTALAQTLFRSLTKKGLVVGSSCTAEFTPAMAADFFKGMSSVQAGSGIHQLKKLQQNIDHRKKMATLYDDLLAEKGWPVRKYDKSVMDPVMVRYPVRIKEKKQALEKAASAGIELGSWFESPLHPEETPLAPYDYTIGMCPEAEKAADEVVNLPLHSRAGEKTARRTVDFMSQFTPA